jgi:1-phosphatidylinositol-4-phosphate 5-kinase
VDPKGYRYEGQWFNDYPNGKGKALYENGCSYIGEFLNNKKHGLGTFH